MSRRALPLALLIVVLVLTASVLWWARYEPAPASAPGFAPGPPASREAFAGRRLAPDLSALPLENPRPLELRATALLGGAPFDDVLFAEQLEEGGPLYVLEQRGVLWAVPLDGTGGRSQVLDVSTRVHFQSEAGALGVALRPARGDLFLYYVTRRDGALYDRVSRFPLRGGTVSDADAEQVLIEQHHEWHRSEPFGEHFGGGLAFGPDGFLYVAFGDEGWVPERVNPQKIHKDLFSGILRLDVDCTPGRSHPAPRQPESGTTAGYCIPDDNPFVGVPHALEEFFLIGLRNPYRFSFDPESHRLWIGDVGSDLFEEIDVGLPGGNYQWSYREGNVPYFGSFLRGIRPDPLIGVERTPLFAYPHGNGNGCIIGGYVYRGTRHAALAGHYVFGDHNSGRVWALLADDGGRVLQVRQVAQVPPYRLLSFGRLADGEILLVGRPEVGVARLAEQPQARTQELPARLSETGLFDDLETLAPAAGVIPYEVNVPAWTDGLTARRWMAIPGDGSNLGGAAARDRIHYRADGGWSFPPGSVFAQHLERASPTEGPEGTARVETRLLVLTRSGSAYAATYEWDEDGREARLAERDDESCLTCHHLAAGYVLGVNARQIDVASGPPAAPASQLDAWTAAGLFTGSGLGLVPVAPDAASYVDPLVADGAHGASLEERARSYLDANCAFCHGPAGSLFDVRREAALDGLVDRPVRHDFGHSDVRLLVPGEPERSLLYLRIATADARERMPPVGRERVDRKGASLVKEWIRSLAQRPEDSASATRASISAQDQTR